MALCRLCCSLAIVAFAALAPGAAFSQARGDPIGPLTRLATFDRAQAVNVGKTKAGKTYRATRTYHTCVPKIVKSRHTVKSKHRA